jgi:hypothetical protein
MDLDITRRSMLRAALDRQSMAEITGNQNGADTSNSRVQVGSDSHHSLMAKRYARSNRVHPFLI